MSQKNRVLRSINDHSAQRCVDIFLRPDGSFGYEEFRRDVEDQRGWFPVGRYDDKVFDSEANALRAAQVTVAWLSGVLDTN